MKYQNELFTWEGHIGKSTIRKELKEKMFQYLGEGQKIEKCDKMCDFYSYDHLIKAMTLFFKDQSVQEKLSQICLRTFNNHSGDYPEIEFESPNSKNKYYIIHFNYNRDNANILPVDISIVSENHLENVIQ